MFLTALEGPDDRRTAFGLHCKHLRALRADPAECLELVECLPHADQTGASARGVEDRVRKLEGELLGEFEPHRLLALDPIGLLQGG